MDWTDTQIWVPSALTNVRKGPPGPLNLKRLPSGGGSGCVCPGWGGQSSRDEGSLPSPEPTHGRCSLRGAEQSSPQFSPRSFP